jgi:hypothetical protein
LDYEFEVQAMFPSLTSIQAIGGSGIVKSTANTLTIKTHVGFNFKKGTNNNANKSIQTLGELTTT